MKTRKKAAPAPKPLPTTVGIFIEVPRLLRDQLKLKKFNVAAFVRPLLEAKLRELYGEEAYYKRFPRPAPPKIVSDFYRRGGALETRDADGYHWDEDGD